MSQPDGNGRLGGAFLVLVPGACLGAVLVGDLRSAPAVAFVLLGAAVIGALGAARWANALPAAAILAAALCARLIAATGTPSLSDDEHRYVHEGRAQRIGLATPYRVPPAALKPPDDDGTSARVNHPDIPAAYPPGTELYFLGTVALGDAIGAPRLPMRAGLLAADVAVLLWLFRLRRRHPAAYLWYGLHPLPILEIALSRHVDALGALFVFAAVVLAARPALAGTLVGLAMHVKPIGALAILGVARGQRRHAALAAAAVAVAVALPHLAAGSPLSAGLVEYATRWRASPLVYAALEAPLRPTFDARARAGVYTHAHISVRPPAFVLEEAGVVFVAIGSDVPLGRKVLIDAGLCARLLAGALLVLAVLAIARLATSAATRTAGALSAFALLTPTLHPWYLLWLVPLAALTGSRALWTLSALAPLLYEPVFRVAAGHPWEDAAWPRITILGATAVAAWLDWRERVTRS